MKKQAVFTVVFIGLCGVAHGGVSYGSTSLHEAVMKKDAAAVRMFLHKNPNAADARNFTHQTPLHLAVKKGWPEGVSLLLDSGADINALDEEKRTPLILAASQGHTHICKKLLEHGAKINLMDSKKRTATFVAAKWIQYIHHNYSPQLETFKYLISQGGTVEPSAKRMSDLHMAVKDGDHAKVIHVIKQDKRLVNAKDDEGRSPLHFAALHGDEKSAELLLHAGADIEARNSRKRTPIFGAIKFGHGHMVDYLLSKGANPNATDNKKRKPSDHARHYGRRAMEEKLKSAEKLGWQVWRRVHFKYWKNRVTTGLKTIGQKIGVVKK